MPEYLAPGVYVEEVDTGSKPIEGVSTSTAGMIGVTERGPLNVPILVTSYGEYVRWFGERLRMDLYSNGADRHCYLPQAVEGFFTNGGKRVFIVRVLDTTKALTASTFLFDRATPASVSTRLLHGSNSGDTTIIVGDGTGLAAGQWLQISQGAEVEYQQIVGAPAASNEVVTNLPLAFAHNGGNTIPARPYANADLTVATNLNLVNPVAPGDSQIIVDGAGPFAGGAIMRLSTAGAWDEEFVIVASSTTIGLTSRVVLRTPVQLPHIAGAASDELDPLPPPGPSTTIDRAAAIGDAVLIVANQAVFAAANVVFIDDGVRSELRRIGALNVISLGVGAYADYAGGVLVDKVTLADGLPNTLLQAEAAAGSNVLRVDDRAAFAEGQVVRIGASLALDREYVRIQRIPDRRPSPDPGLIILSSALQSTHASGLQVWQQTIAAGAPPATSTLALPTSRGNNQLVLSTAGIGAGDFIRVHAGSGGPYFHRVDSVGAPLNPQIVTLNAPLLVPHAAGAPIAARQPLLLVQAFDPGIWGNRLRVSVQDQRPALVNTHIRSGANGIVDGTHIRLDSANGVEVGTVLQRVDANGNLIPGDTPFKVIAIDRQNDYLLTLDVTLPGAAARGDAVISLEFQIDVYLLRQPDLAVPTRDQNVLDLESFRNLSLDPRHSRYVHKIIGTTWSGFDFDDDGQPLRLSDRRSEGESAYVRVRDQAPTQTIRMGPEPLVDILPDGRRRPTRLALHGGDDMISFIQDSTYRGTDNPNPERRTGLHSLRNIEEISIIACPGRTSTQMQGDLITHCELMRYRFAVLDGKQPPGDALADVQNQRQQFDTKYAALYHPWLLVPDPFPASSARIPDYAIPPSGHTVGIYARTDIERGVHKAPANEVVRGIIGLQRILNKEQQDILNPYPVNINVIRDFRDNNRGIRVYGGRCITSDSDWKYVNVRRLLIFIEASIDRGLQWVVFEPNAEPLWARVRRSISNFLTLVWRNGGLEGTKVEEAYFVKCDRTTMTQTDIDSGRLIVVVGVAPVKPAEFVIVRIGLWTARADN
jgi:Bacteriophage tail sheath protein